ncbi:uncharacterized protein LOC134453806 [Engraulis encrasicolus]|uniref:uncharacterized protein LOC134453806 n=1 Tax=Engraulis encrasicolus TaxID=184585 RepID=UPI002FD33AF5
MAANHLSSSAAPGNNGRYIMYHGTSREAAESIQKDGFRPSSDGMLGRGVYLSRDLNKASRYPLNLDKSQRVVIKVEVRVGKVKKIDRQDHPLRKTWHDEGYATAWVPPDCGMVQSGLEEDCVWDPSRITILEVIDPAPDVGFSCMAMWAETDFPPPGQPTLDSYAEPQCGRTYTMYHGTSRQAAASILKNGFRPSSDGMLGRGVYVSRDLKKASGYPLRLPERERVVLKVLVSVGQVKKIDYQGHPWQKTWRQYGYDTAWVPPKCGMVSSGLEEDCVWDPNRIQIVEVIYPKEPDGTGIFLAGAAIIGGLGAFALALLELRK